jgi:hypothetical protein
VANTWAPPGMYPVMTPGAPPPPPTSDARGALLRTRGKGGVLDLICYDELLVVVSAGGTDPAVLGAIIGLFVFSLIGAIAGGYIGDQMARTNAAQRLPRLWYTPPAALVAMNKKNRAFTMQDVRAATLWVYGARQRRLVLDLVDGKRRKFVFDARLHPNAYSEHSLAYAFGSLLRIERRRVRPQSIVLGVVLAVLIVLIVALVVAAVTSSPS